MFFFTVSSGTRTFEINLSAVSFWFKPYIGWIGSDEGETLTIETRASFNSGSTWTTLTEVSNRSAVPDAFSEENNIHADLIEITITFSSSDDLTSPWIDQVFIYFPNFNPYMDNTIPMLDLILECKESCAIDAEMSMFAVNITRDMTEYSYSGNLVSSFDFDLVCNSGDFLQASFPTFELAGNVYPGIIGDLITNLPFFEFSGDSGGELKLILPRFNLSGSGKTDILGALSLTAPQITLSGNLYDNPSCDMLLSIPAFICDFSALTGYSANIKANIPKISFLGQILTGNKSDLDAELPMPQLRIKASEVSINDLTMIFPKTRLIINSGSLLDEILRYSKGKIR